MRTVTFSNPKIAKEVNANYVPVWVNRGPGFHNCELRTEKRIFQTSQEAYSTRNICTFFMTPDEKVLHYVAGYYSPNLFWDVLVFAKKAQEYQDRPDKIRGAHRRFANLARLEVKKMKKMGWRQALKKYGRYSFMGRHSHGSQCKRHIIEAMNYWTKLHDRFSATDTFPQFSAVKADYLSGNRFSEEPRRGTPTRKKEPPVGTTISLID
jgi:hypothetical protein